MTHEELNAIRAIIREEVPAIIQKELEPIKQDIEELKEHAVVTREAVNSLVEWADNVAVVTQIKFPVAR